MLMVKKILFAIKKRGKMSPLNVVVFIIAQTKSRFFFQNFVAKISNESTSSPDYSDAIWGSKKLPSDHCSLQVQSSSSIDKDSRGLGERHNIQLGYMRGNSRYGYTLWK